MTKTCPHCGAPFLIESLLLRHMLREHRRPDLRRSNAVVAAAVRKSSLAKLDAELKATRKTLAGI